MSPDEHTDSVQGDGDTERVVTTGDGVVERFEQSPGGYIKEMSLTDAEEPVRVVAECSKSTLFPSRAMRLSYAVAHGAITVRTNENVVARNFDPVVPRGCYCTRRNGHRLSRDPNLTSEIS